MKTLHLTITSIAGITCLIMGSLTLIVSVYLYEIDSQFIKKIEDSQISDNPAIMGGPIPVGPYYAVKPSLSMIGVILIVVGVILLLYMPIKNRIKIRK